MTRILFVALTLAALTSLAVAQPAPPVANSATNVTTGAFDASWSTVITATNYYLDVSTDVNFGSFVGVYSNFDAGLSTTVTVSGLTPGTTYFYRVRAKDLVGTSVNSNTITVPTLPGAPTANTATGMSVSGFTANWGAVTGATTYKLDVSTNISFSSFVGIYNDLDVGNVASVGVTGLSAGTTYFYRVRGANTSGSGAGSNTITTITLPTAPAAGAATGISSNSFTANWGSVTGAASYKLDVSTDSLFGSFVANNLDVGNVVSASVSGLSAGTRYFYRVRGANASGSGANSNTIATLTLPAAPTANAASNQTQTSFRANWSSVPSAGVYLLDVATDAGFSSIVSGYNGLQVNAVFQDVVGLTNGVTYWYRVRARNSTGDSGNSNAISTVTAPGNPTAIAADSISASGFRARWNDVPSATSYDLDVALDNGFGSMLPGYPKTGINDPSVTYAVGGLSAGTTFYYRVRAVNGSGTSTNSNTISTITVPPAPVAAPGDSVTSTGFRANWGATTGAASYTLSVATDAAFSSMVAGYPKSLIFSTTYAVGGLSGNTQYYYKVQAVNASGTGIASGTITVTTQPPAPTALPATSVLFDRFTANWSTVPSATAYRIDVATDAGFTSILASYNNVQVVAPTISLLVSGLTANTTYYYRVRAEGPGGTSTNSNTVSQLTVPAAPTANSATNVRTTKFTANWTASTGATGYRLDVSTVSNFATFVSGYNNKALGSSALSDSVIGLAANTVYYYRVRAENLGGTSVSSNTMNQTTAPAAPVANAATFVATTSFTANWTIVGGATSYWLDVATDSLFVSILGGYNNADVGLNNNVNVTGLTPGTRYFFHVRAASASGVSDNSNYIGVSTVPPPPVIQAPSLITQTSFQANWSASAGATEYRLYVAHDSLFTSPLGGYNPLALVGTNRSVTGLTAGNRYFYKVRAFNGNLSAYSDSIGLTTLPNIPAAPIAKAALNVSHIGFRANWDSSANATEYRLDVATNSTFTNFVAGYNNKQVLALADSVFPLTPNTSYWYRVRAANIGGTSANSNVINPLTAPAVPGALPATLVASKSITANWTAVLGATGYRLDVATDATFTSFVAGYENLTVAGTTQKVRNLNPITPYYYRVRSVNTGGTSGSSTTITATTLGALTITSASPLPTGVAKVGYSQTLTNTGGLAPFAWSLIAGRLPGGINLSSAGVVSGTPPAADTVNFIVQVMDADSAIATKQFALTVNNPVPTISSISPVSMSRGQTYGAVNVAGTNFLSATTLDLGSNITVNTLQLDSSTHLTANVSVGLNTLLGTRDVKVTNPSPGGSTAVLSGGLTVDNVPSITNVAPTSGLPLGSPLDVVIAGTDFINGSSTVSVGGGPGNRTRISIQNTVVNSPTSITVTIIIATNAEPGPRYFTVSNPGIYPLGGTSNQFSFSVGDNPKPVATNLTPNTGARLQNNLEVTIRGNEFYAGMTSVQIAGLSVSSAVVDSVSKLRVLVSIPVGASTGAHKVYVSNAPNTPPNGGTDSSLVFTVVNPVPTFASVSPSSANRLQTLDLTLLGNKFIQGTSHMLIGAGIRINTTTVDSASQMRVNITVDSNAATGARNISVYNDKPGGDTATIVGGFSVSNPGSGLTSIAPTSALVGDTTKTLTVNGSSFVPGAVVRFDSTALTTTYATTTRLTAVIPTSLMDTARVFNVTVLNPGAGASNALPFNVNNPVPTLTAMAPDSARRLDTINVLLTGTGFVKGFSTVAVTPSGEVTPVGMTYTSATQMTARLFVTPGASLGSKSLVVVNPAPGGGNSSSRTFRVWGNPVPALSSIAPDTGARLQTMNVYFRGNKFIPAVTKADFGAGINVDAIRVDSARGMMVGITISAGAATGARTVAVLNPLPGGDTTRLVNAFTIVNPVPTLSSLSPQNLDLLQSDTITAHGKNFITGVTTFDFGTGITINGAINVVNDSTALVIITVAGTAASGSRDVTVRNSAPGGGVFILHSGFVVGTNPRPRIAGVTPAIGDRLQSLVLVVSGTGFLGGVTSVDLGTNITVGVATVNSDTQLSVPITIKGTAYTGLRDISVTNASPGGGSDTLANGFSVQNPRAVLTSVSPTGGGLGQTLDVVFRGRKYIQGVTGPNMGGDITVNNTIVVADTQMTANITIQPTATIGQRKIYVENPTPGGGRSDSAIFTINTPGAVALSYPADSATGLLPSVALRWLQQNGSQGYRVQVGTSASFPSPLVFDDSTTVGNDTSITVNSLATSTDFYWHVSVRFGGGVFGPWSATRRFKTLNYPISITVATTLDFASKSNATDYLPEEYRMIGIPGASNLDVSAIMPGTNNTDWQAYWDNGTGYVKWSDDPSQFKFSAGRGFWFIRKGQWKLNATAVTSATLDGTGSVVVPLHKDWNIISNPFTVQVTSTQVKDANPGSGIETIWTYGRAASGYTQALSLDTYVGYYILNVNNVPSMRIPYPLALGLGKMANTVPDSIGWRMALGLRVGAYTETCTEFGVHPAAKEGKDSLDIHMPPAMGETPSVYFDRPQWDQRFPRFATDIRQEGAKLEEWTFNVSAPPRVTATLNFTGKELLPAGQAAYIVDDDRAQAVNLREVPAYQFIPARRLSPFRVLVGTTEAVQQVLNDLLPREISLGPNFPNPFNPTTTIPVALPRAAVVQLTVINILGEEVRTLTNTTLEAGRHWITWDGRNNGGQSVATGVYLYRLIVDGTQAKTRKMVLVK